MTAPGGDWRTIQNHQAIYITIITDRDKFTETTACKSKAAQFFRNFSHEILYRFRTDPQIIRPIDGHEAIKKLEFNQNSVVA
jgi:hypothetical protein